MLIFPGSLNGTNGEITLVEKGACKHIGWVFFFFLVVRAGHCSQHVC